MKKLTLNKLVFFTAPLLFTPLLYAQSEEKQTQDMSDPLAVYTQAGAGITNQGLNLKLGNSYDTGDEQTMAMNIIELKGFAGDSLGLDGNDSINSIRFRNFHIDTSNGRGTQIDVNWDFNNNLGNVSYSFIQALPAFGPVQLFPLEVWG